jgi:hypothetical protein
MAVPPGWNSNPLGHAGSAVLLAALTTVLLVMGDIHDTSRRGIPYAVLIPVGYVAAVVLALNAVRVWRRGQSSADGGTSGRRTS